MSASPAAGLVHPSVAELRRIDLFEDLEDEGLPRWAAAAEVSEAPVGAILAEQGEDAPGLQLLLEGTAQAWLRGHEGSPFEPLDRHVGPTWIGAISSLTAKPVAVRMQAETPCRIATIPRERFEQLVLSTPAVHRRIMRQVAPVLNRIGGVQRSRERLAALGTMSAGLAHELNNPAAAAQRASAELPDTLAVLHGTTATLIEAGLDAGGAHRLLERRKDALDRFLERRAADALDGARALEAADAEERLLERLEDLGVEEPWRVAEPLASAGLPESWIEELAAELGSAAAPALTWIAAALTAHGLAAELHESTLRISTLVGAIKRYAYMDRGEVVEVDVHEGLQTTLMILGHKLKHKNIKIVREYDKSLPKLMVRGSELNQVWTNLLANAIEALEGEGTITIRTRRDGPCAIVEIEDDGPGIPAETLPHVFDPFFTTKEVGQGTGLGLDVARRIVVDRHNGSLRVSSRAGATVFHVSLPIKREHRAAT